VDIGCVWVARIDSFGYGSHDSSPYVERLIGTIRRECLDHIIVLNETGLRRVLKLYFKYYERSRTHLSLDKDAPIPRRVPPPELGRVVEFPEVGGLHHRYERRAA
jgi:putative transposase